MTTEQQIKHAASALFLKKGYAATTTRDIAGASGTNVALISYYFGSKEHLFTEIMLEQMQMFAAGLGAIVNDPSTDLQEKYRLIANAYLDLFEQRPDLPLFLLSELRQEPEALIQKVGIANALKNSVLFRQVAEAAQDGSMAATHPMHVIMNLLSMLAFPFIAKPLIQGASGLSDRAFRSLMQERRELVPLWIEMMFRPR
jgi:AcrR family transcriptional regulator